MKQNYGKLTISFLATVTFSFILVMLSQTKADAIPSFARKYETSCQTCHTAFPKLNAFGEAYKRNGYQWTGGQEEEMTKQEKVSLGNERYEKLWPKKAIWPADLAPMPQAAFYLKGNYKRTESKERDGAKSHTDKIKMPSALEIPIFGTIGKDMSYNVTLGFDQEDDGDIKTEIEHGYLTYNDIFKKMLGGEDRLNLKVGKFDPDYSMNINNMRRLTALPWANLTSFEPIHENGGKTMAGGDGHGSGAQTALPLMITGTELSGIYNSRLSYSAGVNAGAGSNHAAGNASHLDFYGHTSYKFGGQGLDGRVFKEQTEPFDRSLEIGALGYWGDQRDVIVWDDGEMITGGDFTRTGLDLRLNWDRASLTGVYLVGTDEIINRADATGAVLSEQKFTYKSWGADVNYMVMPTLWLTGRYTFLDPPSAKALENYSDWAANLTYLFRPNVKGYVEFQGVNKTDGTEDRSTVIGWEAAF